MTDGWCDWAIANAGTASAAGYMRHYRRGEKPCDGCQQARRAKRSNNDHARRVRRDSADRATGSALAPPEPGSVVGADGIRIVPALEELAVSLRRESCREMPDPRVVSQYRETLADLRAARAAAAVVAAPEAAGVASLAERRRRMVDRG